MKVLIENISSVDDRDLMEKPDYISDERWEKVGRIQPLEDKKRSLLAGKLQYRMCEECGATNPVYGIATGGKPVLLNYPQIVFNLSHSGEYVILGYQKGAKSIGVDIQKIKEVSDGFKKRILHENETVWLKEHFLASEVPITILNRIWAIKESYVKMTGEGLSHDFRKLCIDFDKKTICDESGSAVSFLEPEVPNGYVAAMVIEE